MGGLLQGADVVIESGQLSSERVDEVRRGNEAAVVVSITPFGREGPWAQRPATEFTLQALCGSIASRGLASREPLYAAGDLGEWIAGTYAAACAVAFLRGAAASGQGEHVDLAVLECMLIAFGGYAALRRSLGAPEPPGPARSLELPSVEPTADGYIGFCTITRQQFQDFLVLIGHPELVDDDDLANYVCRQARQDEFDALVHAWTRDRTTAEIDGLASAMRIPVAPVSTPSSIFEVDQFKAREVFVENPGGFLQPRPPYKVDGRPGRRLTRPPRLGEHDGKVRWPPRPERPRPRLGGEPPADVRDVQRPLRGLRIIDLTCFWAGPAATDLLAALGADVIKVESTVRPDGMRFASTQSPTVERWWEYGAHFLANNADKRGITLDLARPEGRDLLLHLMERSDALVENFSPRVLDNFGISWGDVRSANPASVMVRMPAFGLDGPWRDRTGFAQTMEQVSGLAWLSGYTDGPPIIPRGPCDPLAGVHAAFALLAALHERDRSGHGHFVESTMVEAALNAAAGMITQYSASRTELSRDGNRGIFAVPQGVYACADPDTWLAIAVASDDQWSALVDCIGRPPWALDASYATVQGRQRGHDAIDRGISAWSARKKVDDAAALLVEHGIPAARVTDPADAFDNDQLRSRSFVEQVGHPVVGVHQIPGMPFRLSGQAGAWRRRSAPVLGQHNAEVLAGLLGMTGPDLARLRDLMVVGDRPAGA